MLVAWVFAALALVVPSPPGALADGVIDSYCPPGPAQCSTPWIVQDAIDRCDATLKFIGGNASAVMFQFNNFGNGDIGTPWSGWLRMNDTFSKAAWRFDLGFGTVWKAQADRGAWYRLRVVGPCHVVAG